MKRSVLAAASLAATATAALAAGVPAKTTTLRTAGYWTAWYTASNSGGEPTCGMTENVSTAAQPGVTIGSFMVKYNVANGYFVHVFKNTWKIPEGTRMPLALTFDRNEPWRVEEALGSGNYVEFLLKDTSVATNFLAEFATASTGTLTFQGGSERPWSINLIGSKEATSAFIGCVEWLDKQTTQPFGKTPAPGAGTTQPFGTKPTVKRDNGEI